ncbi:CPBP family intramembrane glutamic endopeptidase [Methylobacterium nonmethylotrophicum]|uniref:CPBP family intramembrane metalloprotease n=1 Tax=Methylobacterium nonmethylotrophicum TaxID=1141884 RepID=A0A4Z0NX48_9HYPH|nr:type II CAAX endopeptidase family protein [Methylobacterium nonmethylotrophicum]TGE02508.1 CPBP family intramembrane metalloprotease [Methylobacterium nonmethylotrophicum]
MAGAILRVLLLQLAAFALVFGAVAASSRLPVPPRALLPFPGLSGNERALLALTVLPHAALALLVLAASRLRPGALGFRRPALPRRAVLLILAWPLLQIAWTAGLLVASGQAPARAWRLSPFLTGGVFWIWALWLVVLAPLAEEMLFRGDLVGRLRRVLSPAATVAAATLVFVLCHAERGLLQPVSVLPLGVALAVLRLWTGSLWPCIALHAASNGAVVLARVWTTG